MNKSLLEVIKYVKFDEAESTTLTKSALETLLDRAFALGAIALQEQEVSSSTKRARELAGIPHRGNHV